MHESNITDLLNQYFKGDRLITLRSCLALPGDRGVCGLPNLQCLSEVGGAAGQCSTGPADPHSPAVHIRLAGQVGHQPDCSAGEIIACDGLSVVLAVTLY